MTTSEIQKLICKTETLKSNHVCENVGHLLFWEGDVLSINKSGYLSEFEVKVSRSDFLAEKRKVRKWQLFDLKSEVACPNYFWYVCIEGLVSILEIPDYAGLIYASEGSLIIVKPAKLIHKAKRSREKVLSTFCRIITERTYLGGCRLTYENRLLKESRDQAKKNIVQTTSF